MDQETKEQKKGVIVVVAKYPTPGKSKTRLAKVVGDACAVDVARSMLLDVVDSITTSFHSVEKVLLFAPSHARMQELINNEMGDLVASEWRIIPLLEDPSSSLISSDLGAKLADGLEQVRSYANGGGIVFLGMDAPEVPLDEIAHALTLASPDGQSTSSAQALLCPAEDGGYGMLCVPSSAPTSIFEGVRWSQPLTALSQLKAISDAGISTTIGRLMHDIDYADDLKHLIKRIQARQQAEEDGTKLSGVEPTGQKLGKKDVLTQSASAKSDDIAPAIGSCKRTLNALEKHGLISE